LAGFLVVFLPTFFRSNDFGLSFRKAIPLLFTFICTFIANDLDDIEKDRVNHPGRPLATGYFSSLFAVVLYFVSLGLALFSTKYYIAPGVDFYYYGFICMSISYHYVVEYLSALKAPYVAVAVSIPILIVAALYPDEPKLYIVAVSAFFIALGREMCMDIKDRAGDNVSFLHQFGPGRVAGIAFSIQMTGLLLLPVLIHGFVDLLVMCVMLLLFALAAVYWFKQKLYRATILMKFQLFVGLWFLL